MKRKEIKIILGIIVVCSLTNFFLIFAITYQLSLNQKPQTIRTIYRTVTPISQNEGKNDKNREEKNLFYHGLHNTKLEESQQSCGTNFTDLYFGYWDARDPIEVLNDISYDEEKRRMDIIVPFSEVSEYKNNLLVLIYNKNSHFIVHHWWVKRGIEEFKMEIHTVFDRRSIMWKIQSTKKKWIVLCDDKSYLFLTNILYNLFVEMKKETSEFEPKYIGFPFKMMYENEEIIYASLSSGIIINRAAAGILSSEKYQEEFIDENLMRLEEQIGMIMWLERIRIMDMYGLYPDNPETELLHLNDKTKIPSHYARMENDVKKSLFSTILSFGNMKYWNMDKFEKIRRIPKILHQIWIGDQNKRPIRELNECRSLFEISGWKYKLWSDEEEVINQRLYNSLPEWNAKADLLRYEILFKYGGVAMDADTECLRTLDDLIERTYLSNSQIFAACESENNRPGLIAAGVQGVAAYSLSYFMILKSMYLIKNIKELREVRRSIGWVVTGPVFFTNSVHVFNLPVYIEKSKMFFPLHHSEMKDRENAIDSLFQESEKYDSYTVQFWGTTKDNLK